jgi:hypothetical protein
MDGLVFAAGGCDAWNCLSSVEVYDPQTDEWTYAKGMITARRGCGLAVFKGKFVVVCLLKCGQFCSFRSCLFRVTTVNLE